MPTQHTLKAFDEEIADLRAMIVQIGGLAEAALGHAITALSGRDEALALSVVQGDREIDQLQSRIERRAVEVIALRAPMADDLRELVAILRIVAIIERIADFAKNIAKRVPAIVAERVAGPIDQIPRIGAIALTMVHDAVDAFIRQSPEGAIAVIERDRSLDDLYSQVFKEILDYMGSGHSVVVGATHLLFISKYIERIGDHATNISECVYYFVTSENAPDRIRGGSIFD